MVRLESLNKAYHALKPVIYTFTLELRHQIKKFAIFSGVIFFILLLTVYLDYFNLTLYTSQPFFYYPPINNFFMIIVLAVSVFFGGIVCSEYKNKTGLAIFPLINKYKLFIGKYLASVVLVTGINAVFYLTMTLFWYNFYGEPLLNTVLYSYGFMVLFALALGSIAIFLSSFLPSTSLVIIIMLGFLFIWDLSISTFIISTAQNIEPLYSFWYLFSITTNILYPDFSTMVRYDEYQGWLFPSIEGALVTLSLYTILFLILSILLFKRREF